MTCRMAAGQRKKPLRSSNIYGKYRGKKKRKMDSSDILLNLKSHIDLQWDDSHKTVVSKMEQIGISWTDMSHFIDSVTRPHFGVADVISVPHDIYSLVDLSEVLSYEVWASVLSESERKLLNQFLPSGTGAEQVVHSLLEGESHHFGNPFLKWSTSLCTGNLHPDVVLQMEQKLKTEKKAYYHHLKKYHTGMLELLTKWTEKWLSCKDPEKLQSEGFFKNKEACSAVADKTKVPSTTKREMSQTVCTQKSDTDKYISYIQITRAQHQMVKNMKHSGDGILVKSLTRVIGDIKNFHVYSYEKFEEEEKKLMHAHWSQVVKDDIPAAFELARERKLRREQWNRSLEEELAELKLTMSEVEKSQNSEDSTEEHANDDDSRKHHISDVDGETGTDSEYTSPEDNQLDSNLSVRSHSEPSPLVISEEVVDDGQANDMSLLSHSTGTKSQKENTSGPEVSTSFAKQMWRTPNEQESYYHTSVDNEYTSAGELSLGQPQHTERTSDLIDLEREMVGTKPIEPIQSPFEMDNGASLFFGNQDRNEMLPTLPRGSAMLSSYQHEDINNVKQNGLQFLMSNVSLPEPGHFLKQLEEQQLEQREAREKELYMHPMINKNVYASNSYPTQGHFPTIEPQNFTALQPSVNTSSAGYNWFPADNQSYNNWYGIEPSSSCPSVGSGSGSVDESLYNILPNKLSTSSSYNATSSEQFIQARNLVGGVMSNSQNIYGYTHPLENPSFQDVVGLPSTNNGSWMNLPRQNSTLNDSLGRPHIRPWNR